MRILFVCNDLAYWNAHREALALRMVARGHSVRLLSGVAPEVAAAVPAGRPIPAPGHDGQPIPTRLVSLETQRVDPVRDLAFARAVRAEARAWGADVVHLLTLKPILFGGAALRVRGWGGAPTAAGRTEAKRTAAARTEVGRAEVRRTEVGWTEAGPSAAGLSAAGPTAAGPSVAGRIAVRRVGPRVIATFAGLGRVFGTAGPRQRLVIRGLRHALGAPDSVAVFENGDDRDRLVAAGIVPQGRTAIVRGAGFDPVDFPPRPLPPGPEAGQPLRLLFAARLLRSKGLPAVIEAAQILASEGVPVVISVAGGGGGDADAVPDAVLRDHDRAGTIRFLGLVPSTAMAGVIADNHVLLLPTRYPEGTPRILAEAGAVGRGAIVSDHPGCTTFVRDGAEGIVLGTPDGPGLAAAIRTLLRAPERIAAMGAAAQRRALHDGFDIDAVAEAYARLYAGG